MLIIPHVFLIRQCLITAISHILMVQMTYIVLNVLRTTLSITMEHIVVNHKKNFSMEKSVKAYKYHLRQIIVLDMMMVSALSVKILIIYMVLSVVLIMNIWMAINVLILMNWNVRYLYLLYFVKKNALVVKISIIINVVLEVNTLIGINKVVLLFLLKIVCKLMMMVSVSPVILIIILIRIYVLKRLPMLMKERLLLKMIQIQNSQIVRKSLMVYVMFVWLVQV